MVKQYPYRLEVEVLSGGGVDGNGNYLPATKTFIAHANCRDEANSSGRTVKLTDGQAHVYDALIQLPRGTALPDAGTNVRVLDADNNVRLSGTVKNARKDQLHSRIWV